MTAGNTDDRRRYWLFKTEPNSFSWDDLVASDNSTTMWDGIRNYQARNLMRDQMKPGDPVLFYHSQIASPAVIGIAEVVSSSYPDPSQFDPDSRYFDPLASEEAPRWFLVDIRAVRKLERPVTLKELREDEAAEAMDLLRRGNRLSIQPVRESEFLHISKLARD